MLKSNLLVWVLGALVGAGVWHFQIIPSGDALMILGVMLSVLFGFYVTQLTSLIGSSASRFLHERTSEKNNESLLTLFVEDYRSCTGTCLLTIAIVFIYLFFQKQITLFSLQLAILIVSIMVGLITVSLLRLKQMFDVLLKLLVQEAPHADRQTLNDVENVRKADIRRMMDRKI